MENKLSSDRALHTEWGGEGWSWYGRVYVVLFIAPQFILLERRYHVDCLLTKGTCVRYTTTLLMLFVYIIFR